MNNVIDLMPYIENNRAMDNFKQAEAEYADILNNQHTELNKCVHQNKESAFLGTEADLLEAYFGSQSKNRGAE